MKKLAKSIVSILVIGILVFTSTPWGMTGSAASLPIGKDIKSSEVKLNEPFFPPPVIPLRPAQLQNVKYIYQKDIKKVDLTQYFTKEGTVRPPVGTSVTPGTVLVDEMMKTSLYVLGTNPDGTLMVRQPTLKEIFDNFEIPKQTIKYNKANIFDLQPAIRNARLGIANPSGMGSVIIKEIPVPDLSQGSAPVDAPTQKFFSLSSEESKKKVDEALAGGWSHVFNKTVLDAYLADGTKLSVKLSGEVALNMEFVTEYSMFGDYEFGIKGAEALRLRAALDVKINQEVYVPILGINIPFAVGSMRAGLFVVVKVDGSITLVLAGEEGISYKAGVKGRTWFGVPTSCDPYSEYNKYYDAECDPNGQITAGAYLTPTVSLRALGTDVIKAELRVGFKAYATDNGEFLNYGMSAVAQFNVALLGEGMNIFDINIPLFSRQKESPPGGFFFYGDLCAYRDDTVSAVFRAKQAGEELPEDMDPFADKLPYEGPLQIYYYRGDTTKPFRVLDTVLTKDDAGILCCNFVEKFGIDVIKGDSIRIVVPNNINAISKNIFSTMPFNGIRLEKADFFNEIAFGQVQPVNALRDLPGWAKKAGTPIFGDSTIYCKGKTAEIRLVDPNNKEPMVKLAVVTDETGKFSIKYDPLNYYDIRPFKKAVPYINLDGFEIQGTPIDTTAGISFIMSSDYRTDSIGKELVKGINGFDDIITLDTMEEFMYAKNFISGEYTSGDHFIAINRYGTKKIEGTVDYTANAYFIRDIEFIRTLARILAMTGVTVDLRDAIMDSQKYPVYSEHASLPINESNNTQVELFGGKGAGEADNALKFNQPLSTAHAYHRIMVRDGKYPEESSQRREPEKSYTLNTPTLFGITVKAFQAGSSDILDPSQKDGVDTSVTVNMKDGTLNNGFAWDSIYVDVKGTIDIEGCKISAIQSDPWILNGIRELVGITPEQKLKDEITGYLKEGPLYFKRYVINQMEFNNTQFATWRPSANTIKHELSINYQTGVMIIDGIKVTNVARGKMVNGKLFLPAASLARMMGGRSSFNASSRQFTMNAGGRSITLNTAARTAIIGGKPVSISSGILGTDNDIQLSTDIISSLFGATVKVDARAQNVKINFTGN